MDNNYQLIELLAKNTNIEELVEYGSRLMNNPIMLMDSSLELLCASEMDYPEDDIWRDTIENTTKNNDYSNDDVERMTQLLHDVMDQNQPIMTDFDGTRLNRIVSKVSSGGKTRGYIVCIESVSSFKEDAMQTIEMLCYAFGIELQRMHTYTLPEQAPHEKLLQDILSDKIFINSAPGLYLESYFQKREEYRILVIESGENALSAKKVDYLKTQIEQVDSYAAIFENQLVVLLSYKKDTLRKNLKRIEVILNSYRLTGGLSEAFLEISEIKRYYQQAVHACKTGLTLHDSTINHYNRVLANDLIRKIEAKSQLEICILNAILQLEAYDKKKGTDYLNTLECYIRHMGNISEVAKELITHRNTIVHRMEKIAEIGDIDLNDGEIMLNIFLGLKIKRR